MFEQGSLYCIVLIKYTFTLRAKVSNYNQSRKNCGKPTNDRGDLGFTLIGKAHRDAIAVYTFQKSF
jgi:hypothetical protein